MKLRDKVGVVAIGRNEGERLAACLRSCVGRAAGVVYVDSGSTDGSIEMAKQMGVEVVMLDMVQPFTAARARNAGYARLIAGNPAVEFVQFVDGDCEIVDSWFETAAAALEADPKLAVACGRRRERFPDASIYNRLCDIEWDTPVGAARACGGDAMIRLSALRQVGGYNPDVIAGEEPEMCVRLRQKGWTIQRLGGEMTLHDAAMSRFGQWWRRNVRAGHAAAEGAAMHGAPPERHEVKTVQSNWFWGIALPVVAIALAWPTVGLSLLLLPLGYGTLWWRIRRGARRRGMAERDARLYATFTTLGKFPQAQGQLKYRLLRATGRRARLIEYKHPAGASEPAPPHPMSAAAAAVNSKAS